MLAHRLRRRPNNDPTLGERLELAGNVHDERGDQRSRALADHI